jgi:predicted SnoaL-like aldol condensation-catalyzing enzyme
MTKLAATAATLLVAVSAAAQGLTPNEQLLIDFFNFTGPREARAERFMTPDYIQHNPRFLRVDEITGATGRQAWVRAFEEAGRRGIQLVALPGISLRNPMIVMHDGDLVFAVYRGMRPDPDAPDSTYEAFAFESVRIRDGKFSEHWDQVRLAPGWMTPAPRQERQNDAAPATGGRRGNAAAATPETPPPPVPQPAPGCTAPSAQLATNRKLVVSLLEGPAVNLKPRLAADFTDHSPRGLLRGPAPEPAAVSARTVDHVLAECDYVSIVWKQVLRDPDTPSRTWEAFTFDTVRIRDGQLAEHWDSSDRSEDSR